MAVTAIGLTGFALVEWPAFNASNVTRALTTVGQAVTLALVVAGYLLHRRRQHGWPARLLSWTGLAGFVTVTLGMPLAATKLYLFGMSVDQEFRTEFLTRLTDSPALHDMTYAELPSFYPAGWFWVGGRVADLLGMSGWAVFKPYAIGGIAVAAVLASVLWSRLIRADWAVLVTLASTAVVLAYGAPEAYGAPIALLLPPVLVLAWGGLHRPASGWAAIDGTGLFLGFAAISYTLYFAFAGFAVGLMALLAAVAAGRTSGWRAAAGPLLRGAAAAGIAGTIALTVWAPFLIYLLRHGRPGSGGTAFHYLPESGAELPLPMLRFDLLGALCLLGTGWLVARATRSRRAQALGIGVLACYLWALASMAATAAGTTLLSFRLEPILLALLATAGVFGFVEITRALRDSFDSVRVGLVAAVVGLLGAIGFAQHIPTVLKPEIDTAYTDTDCAGQRADRRPPGSAADYPEIDRMLREQTGRAPDRTVLLTADTGFLACYPYFGFQALTSHYANPLADFDGRAAAIADWSELSGPDELVRALDTLPWRAPDAFLFRQNPTGYTLRLAQDVYPNDPNVRRYTVTFPKQLFDDPRFRTSTVGPFVLVVRR
nr:galactan 5-O-arabinofuranosyltransferase [Skermania piniformis]